MTRRAFRVCCILLLTSWAASAAQAQELRVSHSRVTGQASFVTAADGGPIAVTPAAGRAQAEAADFLRQYAALFGIGDVDQQLVLDKTSVDHLGFTHTTFRQVHRGVPVFAGVLKVHQRADGAFVAGNGDFFPVPDKIRTTPGFAQGDAEALALTTIGTLRAVIEKVELVVVDPGWYGDPPRGPKLAWYVVVSDISQAIREAFFIHAHSGEILDRWSLVHTDRQRSIHDGQNNFALPGSLARAEGAAAVGPVCGGAPSPSGLPVECQGGIGDCCEEHGSGGCNDPNCCAVVCNADPFCCDTEWDIFCADIAADFCLVCQEAPDSCGPGSGDCCEANGTPGCGVTECCQLVCDFDPFLEYCCEDEWDDLCAEVARFFCGACLPGACCQGDSCTTENMGGCADLGGQFDTQSDCNTSDEINAAYDYVGDTYDYYFRAFGRDSLDNQGMTMFATVNSTWPPCPNAVWIGTQVVFCRGLVTDDVVGHELTHGVTEFSAGLIYQNQSGQLNESFSDVFGELVDLFNGNAGFVGPPSGPDWPEHGTGSGTDEPNNSRSFCSYGPDYPNGVRWMVGEDNTGFAGAIRDMWNPVCFNHPDYGNSELQTCPGFDNGGVHSGSGVPNHAFAMLTDGKAFNGQDVIGIGPIKSGAVWYRALTEYLTPASDFEDAFAAFNQAAQDLVGTSPNDPRTGLPSDSEFTAQDAAQVNAAMLATEMNTPGACGATFELLDPDDPVRCDRRTIIFSDDMESGVNGWTLANSAPPTPYDWIQTADVPLGASGLAWFCADPNLGDCGPNDESAAHWLISPDIVLPAAVIFPTLEFRHFVATEDEFDGGNVSVRVNGGAWQLVQSDKFIYNPYNGALLDFSGNPLEGQPAWTGLAANWGTTLIDLRSYVSGGETINIRFNFGKDGCFGYVGWYVDDVVVYNCASGDCNNNGVPDDLDLSSGSSQDANGNDVPDECDECLTSADCNDGQFCNGVETCNNGVCLDGTIQCAGQVCNETLDACFQCDDDADCADTNFCNGNETCVNGSCTPGTSPCSAALCDEANDVCRECVDDATCDDGLYCNGPEACENGTCVPGFEPCEGQACDESTDGCFVPQCDNNADCADADICTTDACVMQLCMNTPVPGCADNDDDGVRDSIDACPDTMPDADVNASGCSCDQLDNDADGVDNCTDACRNTPEGEEADESGCSCSQRDLDSDTVNDCDDEYPDTPANSPVNSVGGAESQVDSDGDGITNDADECVETSAGAEVDQRGCSDAQRDDDGDGVLNGADECADSPAGIPVAANGCGQSQVDSDNDGMPNSRDLCIDTPAGQPIDENGCSADQRGLVGLEAGAAVDRADGTASSGTRSGTNAFCGFGVVPLFMAALLMLTVRALKPRRLEQG